MVLLVSREDVSERPCGFTAIYPRKSRVRVCPLININKHVSSFRVLSPVSHIYERRSFLGFKRGDSAARGGRASRRILRRDAFVSLSIQSYKFHAQFYPARRWWRRRISIYSRICAPGPSFHNFLTRYISRHNPGVMQFIYPECTRLLGE